MGDVVELKTNKKHECGDPYCETIKISAKHYKELTEEHRVLFTQLVKVKNMTLLDRIFNWPYGR
jgi:hypothetical protein